MDQHQTDESGTAIPLQRVPVIYVRSATIGKDQLKQRLEDARELAHTNGLDVAQNDCIAEQGSGAVIGRPGLQRVMQMAERGEISHLVTLRPSHLSRDYHDPHEIFTKLAEAGVRVVTGHGTNEPGAALDSAMRHLVARR
ncbi:MAG: recombinase family protein [Janthinobacterium lividum]